MRAPATGGACSRRRCTPTRMPRSSSARAERWHQAYWRHGRDTLGYALHAFRKPRHALHLV
jgi:hypothetical protein